MKKLSYLIVLALILGLVLAGCSLLSNIGQAPATEQGGITYLTKAMLSPDDLVGLWHFDGDAKDSSGDANDGTVHGTPAYVDSPMGQALSFDGVGDYVEVVSDPSIMPATLTVEAWIQPGKIGARQSIVSKWDGGGHASYSLELTPTNKFLFYLHNGTTTQYIIGTTTVTSGTWYHVAGTYDGSKASLYVGGSLEAGPTTLVAPMTDSNVPLRIGASAGSYPSYPIYCAFGGLIDEVRIWKVALSLNQLGDVTPPVVTITVPAEGAECTLGQTMLANWTATDAESGIASATGTVPSGLQIDTGAVGTKPFNVTATDNAGNETVKTVNYYVIYNFSGFFSPVDNLPTYNAAKAGSAIPVKFSLSGNQGLNIFATADYPRSVKITCNTGAPTDAIEATVTAGGSSLNYDAAADQYIYVWKTDKIWAGTCRQLEVKLNDGFTHIAYFKFK
jgi:hypothetical protein